MDVVSKYKFRKIVKFYKGNHRVPKLTCRNQFFGMCFEKLGFRDSLRDVTTTLNELERIRFYIGLADKVSLKTLSDTNAARLCQMNKYLDMILIKYAHQIFGVNYGEMEKGRKVSIDQI